MSNIYDDALVNLIQSLQSDPATLLSPNSHSHYRLVHDHDAKYDKPSKNGQWQFDDSTEAAVVRLFGCVSKTGSYLGKYGSLEEQPVVSTVPHLYILGSEY